MSAPQENTNAVLMLSAITPRDRTTARVTQDIMEMDEIVKVNINKLILFKNNYKVVYISR